MFKVDIDSYQFGGFQGVRSDRASESEFTVEMHALPRKGEMIYVSAQMMPSICFTGEHAPKVETEGHYAGYVPLQIEEISHRIVEGDHRPHLFCRQVKSPFTDA